MQIDRVDLDQEWIFLRHSVTRLHNMKSSSLDRLDRGLKHTPLLADCTKAASPTSEVLPASWFVWRHGHTIDLGTYHLIVPQRVAAILAVHYLSFQLQRH